MRCPNCGVEGLPQDSKYCDVCGRPVRNTPQPTASGSLNGIGTDSARQYFEEGQSLHRNGDYAGAAAAYQRAIALDATHTTYFCELARVYLKLDQPEQALNAVHDAITIKPQLAYPYFLLGYIHYTQGQHHDALREYQRALDLGETGADIHFYVGKAHEKLGQIQPAKAAYERALRQDPNHRYAQDRLRALQ